MSFLRRFMKGLTFVENVVCMAGLLAITFLTVALVINRYWLRYEIMWLGDFTQYVFVFAMLCTLVFTTRDDAHTSVDMLPQALFSSRPKAMAFYKTVIHGLTLGTLFYFHGPMYMAAQRALKYPSYGILVPWFNTSWLIVACYVCILLCIFHTLANMVQCFRSYLALRQEGSR